MLRHLPERDDRVHRPAQLDGDVHSSHGYPADTGKSPVARIGRRMAVFHHHGAGRGFAHLQTDVSRRKHQGDRRRRGAYRPHSGEKARSRTGTSRSAAVV